MNSRNRREFLGDIGRGMLVASLGSAAAFDLGISRSIGADEASQRLTFGDLEPLVSLMQETPPDKLLPLLVAKLQSGTQLKTLVSSAALANARAFGGNDYTGYHTFMALVPAYRMAGELPSERQALPVLKVIYRNSSRIQTQHVDQKDALHHVAAAQAVEPNRRSEWLRDAIRANDLHDAEARFAAMSAEPADAFNQLQLAVEDDVDVHRVVLAWRAWAMLELTGQQYAHTLLRQSVRYCIDTEQNMRKHHSPIPEVRAVLPRLLDQLHLLSKPLGARKAEDSQVEELAKAIFTGTREQAAVAAADALAEGMDPESVGEAISLAANLLMLHDPGRLERNSTPQKPPGCVHGDSVGVHASDAANAWRNISRVSNSRNKIAALIVGAFHTAGQTAYTTKDPYPYAKLLDEIDSKDATKLLGQAEEAIRGKDQARACAIVHRYGELKLPERPVFDLLLKYAVSEDGALHAEKYYRTVSEEFATTRPAFRWRQLVGLARVTASEYGYPAPGVHDACQLLRVS
jgi:hypothetical protein